MHPHAQRPPIDLKLPTAEISKSSMQHAWQFAQFQRLLRHSKPLQGHWASNDDLPNFGHRSRDQCRVSQWRNPHGHIHALLHQIHQPVQQQQPHLNARMRLRIAGDRWRNMKLAERHRCRAADHAFRLASSLRQSQARCIHGVLHLLHMHAVHAPVFSDRQPPRRAMEQPYAHLAFQACPKYIQRRTPVEVGGPTSAVSTSNTKGVAAMVAHINCADTLFISSAGADGLLDVSHKGGRAGFAEWRDGVLRIPDYAGNSMFNTLGNLELDDRAGICIPDFEHSRQWMLTGRAQGLFAVAGTEDQTGGTLRWIEFHPSEWTCVPLNVARAWTLVDSSPFNP